MPKRLPYRVECRDVIGGFEPIAAFDVDVAAFTYARKCAKGALAGASYRVTYCGKTLLTYLPLPGAS